MQPSKATDSARKREEDRVEWLALRQTDSRPMVATLNRISRREWMYGLEDGGRYNKTDNKAEVLFPSIHRIQTALIVAALQGHFTQLETFPREMNYSAVALVLPFPLFHFLSLCFSQVSDSSCDFSSMYFISF